MHFCPEICFTKTDMMRQYHLKPDAVHARIQRALKNGKLISLRSGLYLDPLLYLREPDKTGCIEFVAGKLHKDSYLSLEYVLCKYELLPPSPRNAVPTLTCIAPQQWCDFTNDLGNFVYRTVKPTCYFGYEEVKFHDQIYQIATKAKALFDYLYLNPELGLRNEKRLKYLLFKESPIQWSHFSEDDFAVFESYVWKSNSFKMMRIRRAIEQYFDEKKFEVWRKELLDG